MSVPPGPTSVSGGETPLEQPGLGVTVVAPMAAPAFKTLFWTAGCSAGLPCLRSSCVSSFALQ